MNESGPLPNWPEPPPLDKADVDAICKTVVARCQSAIADVFTNHPNRADKMVNSIDRAVRYALNEFGLSDEEEI